MNATSPKTDFFLKKKKFRGFNYSVRNTNMNIVIDTLHLRQITVRSKL